MNLIYSFSFGKIPYGIYTSDHVAHKQITTGIVPEQPEYATSNLYNNIFLKTWKKVNINRMRLL